MYTADFTTFIDTYLNDNPTRKPPPHGYSGSPRHRHGIAIPDMRAFVKTWSAEKGASLTLDAWLTTLDGLYTGSSVESRIFAGMVLEKYPKFRAQLPLDRLDRWLGELAGWMEIDSTCQSTFTAREVLPRWGEWQPYLRALAADTNMNKRRASLVLLLKSLRSSADPRLITLALQQVDQLGSEKHILISKAVSWVLREGIKHHRDQVEAYLDANADRLPKSVIHEVHTKLTTGTKNPRRGSSVE